MFEADRVYGHYNRTNGLTEWYFSTREGEYGPYQTREKASSVLEAYKKSCRESGNTGGREGSKNSNGLHLGLVPLDSCTYQSPSKKRRNSYLV